MTWHIDVRREVTSITDNMRSSANTALHGPVGLFSQPARFLFYSTLVGATTILIIQVVNTGLQTAMEDD